MRKNIFFICIGVLFCVSLCADDSLLCSQSVQISKTCHFLQNNEEVVDLVESITDLKIRALRPEMIFIALAEACEELSDAQHGTREAKKKKKRRVLWRLLSTAFVLAAQTCIGGHRGSSDVTESIISLCDELSEVIDESERSLYQPESYNDKINIFSVSDKEKRNAAIYAAMNSEKESALFFQELFSLLFGYCSDRLSDLNEHLSNQAIYNFRCFHTFDQQVRMPSPKLVEDQEYDENYDYCGQIALRVFCSVGNKSKVSLVSYKNIDVWCFVKMIAGLQMLSSRDGYEPLYSSTSPTREFLVCDDEERLTRYVLFIDDLHMLILQEDSLATFEKMSTYMKQLCAIETQSERYILIRELLVSNEDGVKFLDEVFLYLHLYLQEKLSAMFSDMFCKLTVIAS